MTLCIEHKYTIVYSTGPFIQNHRVCSGDYTRSENVVAF